MSDQEGFNAELVSSYPQTINDWKDGALVDHKNCQLELKSDKPVDYSPKNLTCRCNQCLGDYRTIVRDTTFKACKEIILKTEEEILAGDIINETSEYSFYFFELKKKIERRLNQIRFRLRRGSFNKLKSDIDDLLLENFGPKARATQVYLKDLDKVWEKELLSQGLRRDLVDQENKDRFYSQIGLGVWKGEKGLKKEIAKLFKAVLGFKRKDISANILKEYLGQFWLYTDARKMRRTIVYHRGPTNSGKTYHAIQALSKVEKGCYLAPLRLLATELYDTLNEMQVRTSLLTGEEVIEVEDGTHTSSTIEMARLKEKFDLCVIDEIQMITDSQRGWAWTRALVSMQAPEIHICGDPSVTDLVEEIVKLCGDELIIKDYERMTKLEVLPTKIKADQLQKNDALIVFSRRNALKYKSDLERIGHKVSIVYGRLSPEVRREQARKFDSGETDIIVSTDAIAMGMNLPIKRIVFTTLSKFINSKEHIITNSEIKQIAGRAGRFKRFPVGKVTCLQRVEEGLELVQEALTEELSQKSEAMVGPDLEIYNKVNSALQTNSLPELKLSEFLRLFNTMTFRKPFYCVDLKEMIEVTEMVEQANFGKDTLSSSELFGFSCAPVNLGLAEHVQYFIYIINNYVRSQPIINEDIDSKSSNIDYLETSIKCVELYQWLARHFDNKNFEFNETELLTNKSMAVEKLNDLLSERIVPQCSSCGAKLPHEHDFAICDNCFKERRFNYRKRSNYSSDRKNTSKRPGSSSTKKKSNTRFRKKTKKRS